MLRSVIWMVILLAFSPASAATIHVPSDQPTIQAGLNAAAEGDTVSVAPGTYYEHAVQLASGVTLQGDPSDPTAVVIDGEQLGIVLHGLESCRIEGLTVRNGLGTGAGAGLVVSQAYVRATHCVFEGNHGEQSGGVFVGYEAGGTFEHCRFVDNSSAGNGAGLGCFTLGAVTVSHCEFVGNEAGHGGGGIWVNGAELTVANCYFEGNTGSSGGGGIELTQCSATISQCSFTSNTAGGRGGGLNIIGAWSNVIECRFQGNAAEQGGGIACTSTGGLHATRCLISANSAERGAGAYLTSSYIRTFTECTIAGNLALQGDGLGGALYCWGGFTTTLENCTLAGNSASNGAGGIEIRSERSFTLLNSILVHSNQGPSLYRSGGEDLEISCTLIHGNAGGDWVEEIADMLGVNGNIDSDPQFCGLPGSGNYLLQSDSPCAPNNNECGVQMGAHPVGCDLVNTARTSWGAIKAMY